jgi:hypothetical protein
LDAFPPLDLGPISTPCGFFYNNSSRLKSVPLSGSGMEKILRESLQTIDRHCG